MVGGILSLGDVAVTHGNGTVGEALTGISRPVDRIANRADRLKHLVPVSAQASSPRTRDIFLEQLCVDGEGCGGSLGSGDDGELHMV